MSQYQPSINDLLLAVRQFIDTDRATQAGQARFLAMCSSYVLGICERELRFGAPYDGEEQAHLARFLGRDAPLDELRIALCGEIRAGRHDARWDELLGLLLDTTANDVRIVKPEHLAPEHRGASQRGA